MLYSIKLKIFLIVTGDITKQTPWCPPLQKCATDCEMSSPGKIIRTFCKLFLGQKTYSLYIGLVWLFSRGFKEVTDLNELNWPNLLTNWPNWLHYIWNMLNPWPLHIPRVGVRSLATRGAPLYELWSWNGALNGRVGLMCHSTSEMFLCCSCSSSAAGGRLNGRIRRAFKTRLTNNCMYPHLYSDICCNMEHRVCSLSSLLASCIY